MVHLNVQQLREAKGISKTYMAKMLGISLQGYRHLETGSVRLDVERLRVIATVLSIEVAVFFDEKLTKSVIDELAKLKLA